MCCFMLGRVCAAVGCLLIRFTAGNAVSNAVDLYNITSGTWSTAPLSVGRFLHAATSVGNVAIFAGGYSGKCSFSLCERGFVLELVCVLLYAWSCLRCSRLPFDQVHFAGPDIISNSVDLYNSVSGAWSTAQLSARRWKLAATSVGNVAFFAGGESGNCVFCGVLWMVCVGVVVRL